MSPILAAVAYGAVQFLAPPQPYVDAGLKVHPQIVTAPFTGVAKLCYALGDKGAAPWLKLGAQGWLMGCYVAEVSTIVLPTENTFPWDHACYLQVLAHEDAHAGDWPDTHPDGHIAICYPKK